MEAAIREIVLATIDKSELKKDHEDLRVKFSDLERYVDRQKEENNELRQAINKCQASQEEMVEEKRKEKFYQAWLKPVLQGGHKKLPVGITDISTEHFDFEIKTYKKWNMAIGQLNLYNSYTKAPFRVLALFDAPDNWTPPSALIHACDKFSIRLVLLSADRAMKAVQTKGWSGSDWQHRNSEILRSFHGELAGRRPDIVELSALFVRRYIAKSDDAGAHFTVKKPRKKWPEFVSELIADGLLEKTAVVPK